MPSEFEDMFRNHKRRKNTVIIRAPKEVCEGLDRVMPGLSKPTQLRILWNTSAVRLEDILGGSKPKRPIKRPKI